MPLENGAQTEKTNKQHQTNIYYEKNNINTVTIIIIIVVEVRFRRCISKKLSSTASSRTRTAQ